MVLPKLNLKAKTISDLNKSIGYQEELVVVMTLRFPVLSYVME